ncbi:MAG: protease inhibitor I42 family protein [archaeon]|nr:protease inhibitor I42 family protein [archaeon]
MCCKCNNQYQYFNPDPNGNWDFSIAENPSTGYHWEWCNHDPTEKLVDSFFVSDNPNIIGSPGRMHFIIHIEPDGKGHYILLNLISQLETLMILMIQE